MPIPSDSIRQRTLDEVVESVGVYPLEAYEFVYRGLSHTVNQVHGQRGPNEERTDLHVGGAQLCRGLRDLALSEWGLLARTVLRRWNITSTLDFGNIVFALVDNGLMQKTEDDTVEDFRNVYDFASAFESDYRIEVRV